mgnify:CR=1 FL=1
MEIEYLFFSYAAFSDFLLAAVLASMVLYPEYGKEIEYNANSAGRARATWKEAHPRECNLVDTRERTGMRERLKLGLIVPASRMLFALFQWSCL